MSDSILTFSLQKAFEDFKLDVRAELSLEGVTAVFGPSGSGKSTLLRLIAGFDRPDTGHISAGSTTWCDTDSRTLLKPHKRPVGYVFQDGRLFNHITVAQNLNYAEARQSPTSSTYTFDEVIAAFDIGEMMSRWPETLSGGERQRVAMAQMLLTRPSLILLDEPMTGLDARRKGEILPYLKRLVEQFSLPILYVSHDIQEVMRIADRVIVLDRGRVSKLGPVVETLNALDPEQMSLDQPGIILSGKVKTRDARLRLLDIELGDGTARLPLSESIQIGDKVRLFLKSSDIVIATVIPETLSIQNHISGVIAAISPVDKSPMVQVDVRTKQTRIPVLVTQAAIENLDLKPSQHVQLIFKTAALID